MSLLNRLARSPFFRAFVPAAPAPPRSKGRRRTRRPMPTWLLDAFGWERERIPAFTKSEARAALKRKYGLPRLPVGLGRFLHQAA